ncbi:MAG: flavin monoamine oxidase family protein [Acidimicrobiia bacterium]|nr:flavin monoamine oxidase family protein [Acidimicrobiia bacterium]
MSSDPTLTPPERAEPVETDPHTWEHRSQPDDQRNPPAGGGVESTDVVVVGAGFAGLQAATSLLEGGLEVTVLEARDRLGGRTHTRTLHDTWVDLGGQWIGPGQDRAADLARRLEVATYPQPTTGDDVVLPAGGGAPLRVADLADAMEHSDLVGYLNLVSAFDVVCARVPLDAPWEAPGAGELDAQTLAEWVRDQDPPAGAALLFEVGVQAVFAAASSQLSLLHAAFYTAAAGGWSRLTDTEGGAQQDRLVGGVQPLAERFAEPLGDRIRLCVPVRRLITDKEGVVVEADEGSWLARRVVVTLPPTLAARIDYDPPLPGGRDQLTQRMPQGSVIKFHVVYPTPWWRERGLSGTVLAPDRAVGVTFDGTPPTARPGIITGFFEGAHAAEAARRTSDERRQVVLDVLVDALGPDAREAIDYIDLDWSEEPFTRGCYGAHLPPGAWTAHGTALRQPVGRIHWAGTETARAWAGYIEGALESGERVAEEILAAERKHRRPRGDQRV